MKSSSGRLVQLAGRFVAWEENTASQPDVERIAVLDVRARTIRRVGSTTVGGHEVVGSGIAGFVLSPDGVVVWLLDTGSQEGPFCSFSSALYYNAGRNDVILDRPSTSKCAFPITSFGLSTNRHVVYWTDNGQANSATVAP
jgi:hypothetical protein